MKIVLHAFGNKLSGVMEVPEETGHRFKLVMTQPITAYNFGDRPERTMLDRPIETICEFEWTGGTYSQDGHSYDKARVYQLINIDKR